MADPWLSIIGLGEDGLNGLPPASRAALDGAEIVFGAPRHLDLADVGTRGRPWPVPFDVAPVLAARGSRVAVLASGDPFWHGAGGSLVAQLEKGEWHAFPAPSTISLAAAALGWKLEEVQAMALHAAPVQRLTPLLAPGARFLCTLRDGAAVSGLAVWLDEQGFGESHLTIMEALGGPRQRIRETEASLYSFNDVAHPVTVAIEALGGRALPRASGLPDDLFVHDGQITKRPIRALTLSALAPRPGQHLWDLGAGSGSISVEFCLAAPATTASAVETRAERADNIRENARRFGLEHRLAVIEGASLDRLDDLPDPDVIFIGGGASEALLKALWSRMAPGTSLVANAVTLETETLLTRWQGERGGHLLRVETSRAAPLGSMRGWDRARPVLQWSITR
jgi:precorrin-6B C5,15-methyltransferase / cobalt-precorrin-6B C5,C15-methyltransferase